MLNLTLEWIKRLWTDFCSTHIILCVDIPHVDNLMQPAAATTCRSTGGYGGHGSGAVNVRPGVPIRAGRAAASCRFERGRRNWSTNARVLSAAAFACTNLQHAHSITHKLTRNIPWLIHGGIRNIPWLGRNAKEGPLMKITIPIIKSCVNSVTNFWSKLRYFTWSLTFLSSSWDASYSFWSLAFSCCSVETSRRNIRTSSSFWASITWSWSTWVPLS